MSIFNFKSKNKNKDPTKFQPFYGNDYVNTYHNVDDCISKNDTLQSIIYTIANNCSKFQMKHTRNGKFDTRVDIKKILKRPNELMGMSDFIQKMVFSRELYNNAFAYLKRDEIGNIVAMYHVEFSSVEMLKSKNNEIFIKFTYKNGENEIFNYKDVIHLRKHFYNNDFFGSQYNTKLNNLLNIHENIDNATNKSLQNTGVVKWLMQFKTALQDTDAKKQVDAFNENYLNVNNNSSGVITADPRYDMKQIESKEYYPNKSVYENAENRIYSFFNVNKKIVQSDYTESEYNAFYENVLEPILKQLSEEMTYKFFTETELGYSNEIIINPNLLQFATLDKRNEIVNTLTQVPNAITVNEVRGIFYLDKVENGDNFANRADRVIKDDTK